VAQVLALVDDLFFQAKLLETAKQLAVDLRVCTTPDAILAETAKGSPRLIVLDLNCRTNPLATIPLIKNAAPDVPLIGFLSHVQTELADEARRSGCTNVMPRSKFTRDLATILAQAKSEIV
jgi:DNA-binding NtrC family response regulator